jgi:kinetochore protein Nuf2
LRGWCREELKQPAFHAVESLEYPELHEESVGCVASIRAIMKLMFAAGAQEFSMKDIFKPESKRTITFLSAIINYAKFRSFANHTKQYPQSCRFLKDHHFVYNRVPT